MLRLVRNRANDPMLQGTDLVDAALRAVSGREHPCLESSNDDAVTMELPDYELRRLLTARDPRAVVEAYMIEVRLRLALLLGIRMCPRCPHCNAEGSSAPCQNRFGSNMLPMGGILGGVFLGKTRACMSRTQDRTKFRAIPIP